MPHVLVVQACQFGHPVTDLISTKADDGTQHGWKHAPSPTATLPASEIAALLQPQLHRTVGLSELLAQLP